MLRRNLAFILSLVLIGCSNKREIIRDKNFLVNYGQVCEIKSVEDKEDYWQTPSETLGQGGDCEDKAILLDYILKSSHVCRIAFGRRRDEFGKNYLHVWNLVRVSNKVYVVDPTLRKIIPYGNARNYDDGNFYFETREKVSEYNKRARALKEHEIEFVYE